MVINEHLSGKELRLALDGNFDENSSPAVEKRIEEILKWDIHTVLFDMSRVHYISSIGIRVLILAHKKAVKCGKRIVIGDMSAKAKEVLEMVGVLPLFGSGGE